MRISLELVVTGSAQSGGKEIAKVLFDSSVHKTGWKLILSQNVGKLLNVVVEADASVIDIKSPVHVPVHAFVLTPICRGEVQN